MHAKPGDESAAGEALAHVHARDRARAEQAEAEVLAAYTLVDGPSSARRCCSRRSADRMPELPEVETVRRRLVPHLTGRTLAEVEILDYRLTDPEPPRRSPRGSRGARVEALDRRGKYLLLRLATVRRSRCTCG